MKISLSHVSPTVDLGAELAANEQAFFDLRRSPDHERREPYLQMVEAIGEARMMRSEMERAYILLYLLAEDSPPSAGTAKVIVSDGVLYLTGFEGWNNGTFEALQSKMKEQVKLIDQFMNALSQYNAAVHEILNRNSECFGLKTWCYQISLCTPGI